MSNAVRRRVSSRAGVSDTRPASSDHLWRDLVELLAAIPWEAEWDPRREDVRFTFVGPRAWGVLGYPPEQWLSPGFWRDILLADDRAGLAAQWKLAIAEGQGEFEHRMMDAQGRQRRFRTIVRSDPHHPRRVHGLFVEIGVKAGPADGRRPHTATAPSDDALVEGERYRRVVELSPDAIALHRDGRVLYANRALTRLLGVESLRDLIGRPILDLVHPDYHEVVRQRMRQQVEEAQPVPLLEEKILRADGSVVDVEIAGTPIIFDGGPAGQVVIRDITERKRAERDRQEADAKYRNLVEQLPAVVYIDSLQGPATLVYISPRVEQLLGFTPEEWKADPDLWAKFMHPEDRDRELAAVARHHAAGEPYQGEYRMYSKSGELKWFLDEALVLRDDEGRPLFCQGVMHDITEQKRAEEERQGIQQLMRATLESTADGLLVVDPDGHTTFANGQFARMWRIPAEMLEAGNDEELLQFVLSQLKNPDAFLAKVRELYGSHEVSFDTIEFKDGRAFERYSRPLSHDDQPGGRVWSFRDVTDRRRAESELHAAESKYRALVEHVPAVFFVDLLDDDMTTIYVSPQIESILGLKPEEYLSRPGLWSEHLHPEDRERARQIYLSGRARGEPFSHEYRMIRPDGQTVWIDEVAVVLRDAAGRPNLVQGAMFDITERKRAERELMRRNEFLAAMHETALAMMNRLELEDVLKTIVTAAGSLVGTPNGYMYVAEPGEKELVARAGTGVFREHQGFRLKPGEGLGGRVWRSGEPLVIQDYDSWEGRSPAFPYGVFHAVAGVPLKSGGRVVGALGLSHVEPGRIFSDEDMDLLHQFAELASIALDNAQLYTAAQDELRERTAAEAALRFQAQLLAAVQNAVIATDEKGLISYWNHYAETLYGWPAEDVLGRPVLDVILPAHMSPEAFAAVGNALSGDRWSGEFELQRRDGSTFTALVMVSPVESADGKVTGTIGVSIDVTERKRAEEALLRAFEQEKEISKRLRAIDEMKNTFLHAVSHELRTPLAAVLGLALTMERADVKLSPEESRDLARRLAANARKLDQLLSDLLDLDRLDRGILEPRRHPTDVGALVRRVVEGSEILGDRPIRVDADLVVVSLDAPKVERIVENLLANAARHTPPGSTVWVRVAPEGEGVLVAVEDEGPGIPKKFRRAIFEPFSRGPKPSAHSPGVGVGLSLVDRFARLHGGKAWVEDREGGGASFRVYLPGVAA